MQSSSRFVDPTVITWTHQKRHKISRSNGLVCFSATLVTSVSGNLQHWLNLSSSGDDTANVDQFANRISIDISYRQRLDVRIQLERDFIASHQFRRESVLGCTIFSRLTSALLHQLSVVDVDIQGILGCGFMFTIIGKEFPNGFRRQNGISVIPNNFVKKLVDKYNQY